MSDKEKDKVLEEIIILDRRGKGSTHDVLETGIDEMERHLGRSVPHSYCSSKTEIDERLENLLASEHDSRVVVVTPMTYRAPGDGLTSLYSSWRGKDVSFVIVGDEDRIRDEKRRKEVGKYLVQWQGADNKDGGIPRLMCALSYEEVIPKLVSSGMFVHGKDEKDTLEKEGVESTPRLMNAFVSGFASRGGQLDMKGEMESILQDVRGLEVFYTDADIGRLLRSEGFADYFTAWAEEQGGFDRMVLGTEVLDEDGKVTQLMDLSGVIRLMNSVASKRSKIAAVYDSDDYVGEMEKLSEEGLFGTFQVYQDSTRAVRDMIYDDAQRAAQNSELGASPASSALPPARIIEFEIPKRFFVEDEEKGSSAGEEDGGEGSAFNSPPPGSALLSGDDGEGVLASALRGRATPESISAIIDEDLTVEAKRKNDQREAYRGLMQKYAAHDSIRDAVRSVEESFALTLDQQDFYFELIGVIGDKDTEEIPLDEASTLLLSYLPQVIQEHGEDYRRIEGVLKAGIRNYDEGGAEFLEGSLKLIEKYPGLKEDVTGLLEGAASADIDTAVDSVLDVTKKLDAIDDDYNRGLYLRNVVSVCAKEGRWDDMGVVADSAYSAVVELELESELEDAPEVEIGDVDEVEIGDVDEVEIGSADDDHDYDGGRGKMTDDDVLAQAGTGNAGGEEEKEPRDLDPIPSGPDGLPDPHAADGDEIDFGDLGRGPLAPPPVAQVVPEDEQDEDEMYDGKTQDPMLDPVSADDMPAEGTDPFVEDRLDEIDAESRQPYVAPEVPPGPAPSRDGGNGSNGGNGGDRGDGSGAGDMRGGMSGARVGLIALGAAALALVGGYAIKHSIDQHVLVQNAEERADDYMNRFKNLPEGVQDYIKAEHGVSMFGGPEGNYDSLKRHAGLADAYLELGGDASKIEDMSIDDLAGEVQDKRAFNKAVDARVEDILASYGIFDAMQCVEEGAAPAGAAPAPVVGDGPGEQDVPAPAVTKSAKRRGSTGQYRHHQQAYKAGYGGSKAKGNYLTSPGNLGPGKGYPAAPGKMKMPGTAGHGHRGGAI